MKKFSVFILVLITSVLVVAEVDQHFKAIAGAGPVKVMRTTAYDFDVSMGHFQDRFYVNEFGHNDDIDTTTVPEDIWHGGGLYPGFPTGSAELIQVVSTSAADAAAGTGCQTVLVTGLDANYERQEEIVTLAGLTPVDTVNTYIRSNRSYCLTAGSGGTNAGDITIQHTTTTANIFGILEAGVGQTQTGAYTVPLGYNCYVREYEVSFSDNANNKAEIGIWIRTFGGAERIVNQFNVSTAYYNNYKPRGADPLPEKTDFVMRVQSVQNNDGHVNFTGSLICVKEL